MYDYFQAVQYALLKKPAEFDERLPFDDERM
jgi:hypothetical protein